MTMYNNIPGIGDMVVTRMFPVSPPERPMGKEMLTGVFGFSAKF